MIIVYPISGLTAFLTLLLGNLSALPIFFHPFFSALRRRVIFFFFSGS